jgi:hypothetical protein
VSGEEDLVAHALRGGVGEAELLVEEAGGAVGDQ